MKHKSEDYKISAVKYYLKNNKSIRKTCKIFECTKSSLQRWIYKYKKYKNLKRRNRPSISYKIKKIHIQYAIKKLKENEQLNMVELYNIVKRKYKDFNITPQHLGIVIRDNNITRKRSRHEHFPKERYKRPIVKKEELNKFYKEVQKYPLNKIICLDETSIKPLMFLEYSRCSIGKRCIIKTDDSYIFRSFTLLCAISNSKCVGHTLYEKGGMTKERFVEFLQNFIFNKYKNHLIILDNAGSHNNQYVKDAIINNGNKYLFSIPYSPVTNAIENFFSQIKHMLKLNKKVLRFPLLQKKIRKCIKKVKKENYKNYFDFAYKRDYKIFLSKKRFHRKRKLKVYKD